jgi:hypothetical protein
VAIAIKGFHFSCRAFSALQSEIERAPAFSMTEATKLALSRASIS